VQVKSLKKENSLLMTTLEELKQEKSLGFYSSDNEIHPINKHVQECMKQKNYTTIGMSECVYNSTTAWNKEIDNSLVFLENRLTKEQYRLLKQSQIKWEEYKDAQWQALSSIYNTKQGTLYINILAAEKVKIVESRAKNLNSIISILFK